MFKLDYSFSSDITYAFNVLYSVSELRNVGVSFALNGKGEVIPGHSVFDGYHWPGLNPGFLAASNFEYRFIDYHGQETMYTEAPWISSYSAHACMLSILL